MEKFFALSKEKQDTVRNAALVCFSKHGYEKASIHDIAVAAGIS
ncbi:MAG: TetR family transcriptional regulator, partial [Bacteroidales bacterium]|nr:TetR family transcriptional regulator [Bacteroidales bacterium]